MKILRFRKKAEAASTTSVGIAKWFLIAAGADTAQVKKPNPLRRFAHKAKKIFGSHPPPSSTSTSTFVTPPAQLQELTAQSSTSINEDLVLASAERLIARHHPVHVLDPRREATIRQHHEALDTPKPPDSASSVYSQSGLDQADLPLSHSPKTTPAATSTNALSNEDNQNGRERETGQLPHTRGQKSHDLANGSFFVATDAGSQHRHESTAGASLTYNAEDISDFLALAFGSTHESDSSETNNQLSCTCDGRRGGASGHSHPAQTFENIERVCRQRVIIGAHLKTQLNMQKESLEAGFDRCYDTSDRLHEIDLLNLKEDHEAEVKDLQEVRDAALAEIKALTAEKQKLNLDLRCLDAQVISLEHLVKERTEEGESFRCQAKLFWEENNDLLSEIGPLRQAVKSKIADGQQMGQLEELKARNYEILSQLSFVTSERDTFRTENADLVRRYQDVYAAYEAESKEKECVKRQLTGIVEEKGKDFSWHMRNDKCHLALKPEDPEQAESNATAMARELHRREAEKVLSLRARIAEMNSTTEIELRQQAQVIEGLSEEASSNAIALEISLDEQAKLAKTYQELLIALSTNRDVTELARGLAHDLQKAFEERALFALAYLRVEQQLVKGHQQRRAQVCDLKDLIQEKDSELSDLRSQLRDAEFELSTQEFILESRDDEIKKTVPGLKDRITELELIMEEHAMSASRYHRQVIADLRYRLEKQAQTAALYEHHYVKTLYQLDNLKTEWDFYVGATASDMQLARGFRDQRDALNAECLAMRERFADELLVQPLAIPETLRTRNEDEEQQLDSMHRGVLKQFLDTYKALPKWLVEPGCPGYEVLRAEVMDAERERMERDRQAIDRSFFVAGEYGDGDSLVANVKDAEEECFF